MKKKVRQNSKKLNENLFVSADRANTYANFLGPMNAQIGNISYVMCAIVGGALALNHVGGFTLGGLASFLTFNKKLQYADQPGEPAAECDCYGTRRCGAYLYTSG